MATFNDALERRLGTQQDAFKQQKGQAFEETDRLDKQNQRKLSQRLQRQGISDSGVAAKQSRLSRAATTQALQKRLTDIDIERARQRERLEEGERQREFLDTQRKGTQEFAAGESGLDRSAARSAQIRDLGHQTNVLTEQSRAAKAGESLDRDALTEQGRAAKAGEGIEESKVTELSRANLAKEGLTQQEIDEIIRSSQTGEAIAREELESKEGINQANIEASLTELQTKAGFENALQNNANILTQQNMTLESYLNSLAADAERTGNLEFAILADIITSYSREDKDASLKNLDLRDGLNELATSLGLDLNTTSTSSSLVDPSSVVFDEQAYLAANPDVANAIADGSFQGSARDHFEQFGKAEGRDTGASPGLDTGLNNDTTLTPPQNPAPFAPFPKATPPEPPVADVPAPPAPDDSALDVAGTFNTLLDRPSSKAEGTEIAELIKNGNITTQKQLEEAINSMAIRGRTSNLDATTTFKDITNVDASPEQVDSLQSLIDSGRITNQVQLEEAINNLGIVAPPPSVTGDTIEGEEASVTSGQKINDLKGIINGMHLGLNTDGLTESQLQSIVDRATTTEMRSAISGINIEFDRVLGRAPSAQERKLFESQIRSGVITRASLRDAVTRIGEGSGASEAETPTDSFEQVDTLFSDILGSAPSSQERKVFGDQLASGKITIEQLTRALQGRAVRGE